MMLLFKIPLQKSNEAAYQWRPEEIPQTAGHIVLQWTKKSKNAQQLSPWYKIRTKPQDPPFAKLTGCY